MTKRHLIAFVTAASVYGMSFFGYSYMVSNDLSSLQNTQQAKLNSVMKIALYTPPVQEPKKCDEPKKIVEKVIQKIEHKQEKIVKKIEPKKEKIVEVKKEIKKTTEVIKKVVPQILTKQENKAQMQQEATTQTIVQKNITTLIQKKVDTQKLLQEKNRYLIEVKKIIESNKFYPLSAKRRGIESNIPVKFVIEKDGTINNIEILGGKKIFYKSVQETLSNSFPIDPKGALKESIEVSLVLKYNLI